jgi:hypothetical protein
MSRLRSPDNKHLSAEHFVEYFDEYYEEADLDILFSCNDVCEFIDNSRTLLYKIIDNLILAYDNTNNLSQDIVDNSLIQLNKICYVNITTEFLLQVLKTNSIDLNESSNMLIPFNTNMSLDDKINYIIENKFDNIIELFRPYYLTLINCNIHNILSNIDDTAKELFKLSYPELFNIPQIFKLRINDKTIPKNTDHRIYVFDETLNISLFVNYKFNIRSPYLARELELFMTYSKDFFNIISSFHLACVRAYYNGVNLYLTPSCISAHLTYMNMDYSYMHGNKNPLDILHKYRVRGFGTWLNKSEKNIINAYTIENDGWKSLYNASYGLVSLFGPQCLNNKIFRPLFYSPTYYKITKMIDRYNNAPLRTPLYKEKIQSITKVIIKKFNSLNTSLVDYDKLICINNRGNIKPLELWVIRSVLSYI